MFKDSLPSADAGISIRLDMARNEFEAAQVVLRRPEAYRITGVGFSALTGPAGSIPAGNLSYNFVGHQQLGANTGDIYPVTRLAPGDFPDRLLNEPARDVPAATTQSIWVKAYVPAATPAGVYGGTVRVETSQGQFTVAVSIDVRAVTLLPAAQGSFTSTLWQLFTGPISWDEQAGDTVDLFYGFPRYSSQWWELMENVAASMREHRTNGFAVPVVRHLIDAGSKRNPDGSYTINFDKFDQVVQFMIDRGVVKRLEGFWEGGRRPMNGNQWSVEAVDAAGRRTWLTWDSPEGQNWINQFIPALRDHIRAKGWEPMFWTHIGDEPTDTVQQWRGTAASVRRNWPNVKLGDAVFTFSSHQQIIDQTDLVIPQTDTYDNNREFYDRKRAEGKELWWYNSTAPRRNYLNRFVDQPYWHQRLQGWSAYGRGVTGYLHWAMNNWQYTMEAQDAKGDGYIVRPDKERRTIEVSLRYESLRDGIEDYEVLGLLAKTDPGLARGLAQSLVQRNDKYTPDTAYMQRVRALALDAAAGRPISPDLARAATTTASAGNGALAVDGSSSTAWQPGTGSQWLRVDLGRQVQVDGIGLRWSGAGVGYKVQTSYDGNRWTEVFATGTSDGGTDFVGLNGKARYLRVETTAGTPSLTDLQVSGFALARANLAGGRTYTRSPAPNNQPDSGIESTDGVLADAWDDGRSYGYQAPNGSVDITLDLGSAQAVGSAAVHVYEEFPAYRPDNVRISTSVDGTTYTQRGHQFAPRGPSGLWYDFQFPATQARYVRLTFAKTYSAEASALLLDEIEVYAAGAGQQNAAGGRPYTKSQPAVTDPAYPDTGGTESTDGVVAGRFDDGKSHGYRLASPGQSITLDLLLDLGSAQQLSQVRVAKYSGSHHDYAPGTVQVYAGDSPVALPLIRETTTPVGTWYEIPATVTARYVKVRLTKTRSHDLADYLFADEVQVLGSGGTNLALNRPYRTSSPPLIDPSYPDTGNRESTDGVIAGGFADGHGYGVRLPSHGDTATVELLVDLGSSRSLSTVRLQQFDNAFHHYPPDLVKVWTGDSPVTMTAQGQTRTPAAGWYEVPFASTTARYICVQATKTRTNGLADYLFLDELTAG